MKLTVVNTSVVVLAKVHNPTILHPSFLAAQGIVPKEWELAEPPVCTPAIALVKYSNAITFTAEMGKFQVMNESPSLHVPIADLALKYTRTLPHVHYTAVGVNILATAHHEDPHRWVLARFFSQGTWNSDALHPSAAGIKLIYRVDGADLHLTIDAGTIRYPKEEDKSLAIILSANYHTNLTEDPPLDQAQKGIARFRDRVDHFLNIAQIVLGEENELC